MAKLKSCPICGGAGIGPFPVGETGNPGELFYATTVCDHVRVGGRTEEEVIEVFNRRVREEMASRAIDLLLHNLPDSATFEYAWEECTSDEQGEVKRARDIGEKTLATLRDIPADAGSLLVSIPYDIATELRAYLSARLMTCGGFPMETTRAEADGVEHLLSALGWF
jgi:hypothetical protein